MEREVRRHRIQVVLVSCVFAATAVAMLSRADEGGVGVSEQGLSVPEQAVRFFRLQLKHNLKFADADHCTDVVKLTGRSDWEGGACQLWRLVPAGGGWYRLQLKHGGKYLDASYCTDTLKLTGKSDYDGGACQLWKLEPAGGGWSRLQLKHGGKYLDASYCTDTLKLSGKSDYDGGACQLWRMLEDKP